MTAKSVEDCYFYRDPRLVVSLSRESAVSTQLFRVARGFPPTQRRGAPRLCRRP